MLFFFSSSSFQPNTFQAALLTDGLFSFSIFNYREDEMLWDTNLLLKKDVIIGYNSIGDFYQNAQLDTQYFSSEDSRYRPDKTTGNTGLQGRFIYRLENNTADTVNYKRMCLNWYEQEPDHTTWSRTLGVCPCGFEQGRSDNSYGRGQTPPRGSRGQPSNARRLNPQLLREINELQGKMKVTLIIFIKLVHFGKDVSYLLT